MKKIVLASGNAGKLKEFREILKGYDIVTPKDMGIDFDVEETGETFYENALIKARALYELCHLPTVADDSGLCVDVLGGAPGVYSARYEGGMIRLLKELAGVKNRAAHFTSCIVYYDGENIIEATGYVYGKIADAPRGNNGFGYDPVFMSDELGKTFGAATSEEKNAISHRRRALDALFAKLNANKA